MKPTDETRVVIFCLKEYGIKKEYLSKVILMKEFEVTQESK